MLSLFCFGDNYFRFAESTSLPHDNSTSCDTPKIKLCCRYLADFHILSRKPRIASFCYTYFRYVKTARKPLRFIWQIWIYFFHKKQYHVCYDSFTISHVLFSRQSNWLRFKMLKIWFFKFDSNKSQQKWTKTNYMYKKTHWYK